VQTAGANGKLGETEYNGSGECPFYKILQYFPIPDYETPEQYEERTGKAYPDNGLVWVLFEDGKWEGRLYKTIRKNSNNLFVVIADPPFPPPDGWKPEEEVS
jgi:hypothetical protein